MAKGMVFILRLCFDFTKDVLNDNRSFYCFDTIEVLREELRQNQTELTVDDFGAGSKFTKFNNNASVSSIAASSLKTKKFSQLCLEL